MKIQELNLACFGPFTDKALVFDQEIGLHIFYGPNEAGKSSALRGLKALLYGIHERTPDNFLHDNTKLRIHGRLRNLDGYELAFSRRKGRKKTLLTLQGEELDEQVLAPFLQGVTPDLFETLFGIDHLALVQGGQEILEQKGEVGQALFSAALGSHALHAVLGQLDDEADSLFRPRGSTQKINAALKAYTKLQEEIRESSLSSRQWDEHRRDLLRTTRELQQIQAELAEDRTEINRLKRIQRVLAKLARRRELLQERESMADTVILPDDFTQRRQQAMRGLEAAQAIGGKATPRLQGLQQQLEGLSVNTGILQQAENIEDLHTRLGGHRKALQDRPRLEAECQQLLTDAESILKDVRPDLQLQDIETLHPVVARRQAITELGNQHAVLITQLEQAASSRRDMQRRLKVIREEYLELPESGSSTALRKTIAVARKLGDVDTAIQSAQSELVSLQSVCNAELSRLTLWDGELEALMGLAAPNQENINRFEKHYDEIEQRFHQLREKQQEAAEALQDATQRLDEIQRVGAVPTEADLVTARSDRDQLWHLLRRQCFEGEDTSAEVSRFGTEGTLPDTFEGHLADTDELSDRLRREADRVLAKSSLQARQEAVQQQIREMDDQLEACADDKRRLDTEWQALWASCQILPRTPREMRVWLNDLEKLREQIGQLTLRRLKTAEMEQNRNTHIQQLNRELTALGKEGTKFESLDPLLQECEELAQQLDESHRKRDAMDQAIKDREADVELLTEDHQLAMEVLEAWKIQWRELIQSIGLRGDASPTELGGFIEKVRALFEKQSEAEKLRIRIEAIDKDAASYRSQVASMVAKFSPQLVDLPADDAVMRLHSLLSDNRSKQIRRQQITEQLEQTQQENQDATATIQTMTDRLDALCAEAKCKNRTELEQAERHSAHYLQIQATIDAIEQEILETGEGASVAALEKEAQDTDPDVLPGRIEALNIKIDDELEPSRTELAETKGREEKELELMDGSDQAAILADQAQAILASIRSDAERYVRVKLAGRVLRDEIERYRRENQGPLVKRASEHFAALTLESFVGLMTDLNEKDEPVLAGVRTDGEKVHVEGMSSGTRDQLYLALRLASLEKYMESAEPMPFIVDDILVDFDDQRSQAALNALSTLAEKTQVILFTHHSQVVDQAKQLQRSVQVYELGTGV